MFFTSKGRVFWLKTYDVPEAERYSKGRAIVNLLGINDEKITKVISVKNFEDYLIMATRKGVVKKISLSAFSKPRASGIRAINMPLDGSDDMIGVEILKDKQEILLSTKKGKSIRFNGTEVRASGRASYGVTGIKLDKSDDVVSLEVLDTEAIMTITEKGYGKRTAIDKYRKTARAGKGITNLKVTDKTGKIAGMIKVTDEDSIMVTTQRGMVIRTATKNFRLAGRSTQGVRIIKLSENDKAIGLARIKEE